MFARGVPDAVSDLVAGARSADDALVVEFVDDAGHVDLVFGAVRVPGVLCAAPAWLVEGTEHEVVVFVGDERVGVCFRVVVGCQASPGEVARVQFVGLDVAGRRLGPAPTSPAALAGRLDQIGLTEVVQLACAGRRDAVIDIRTAAVDGVIMVRDGRAVYARCVDGRGGEEAFFALVSATTGSFELRHTLAVPLENLAVDTTWLLLEAMRRLDAGPGGVLREDGAGPAPGDGAPAPTTGTSPSSTNTTTTSMSTSVLRAAVESLAAAASSRDEEHVVEPILTPRDLRRHSQPPTAAPAQERFAPSSAVSPCPAAPPAPTASPTPAAPPSADGSSRPTTGPQAASGPPLPARATGRFARFFQELSEVDGVVPSTASLAPSDDVDVGTIERFASSLFDSDEGPAFEEETTMRLRFAALKVQDPPRDEVVEDDARTECVPRSQLPQLP
jgi:hypothetical protein